MSTLLNVIVDGMWCQGENSLAIRLVSATPAPLPDWQPGAHVDVHLPGGVIRQYSLTGNQDARSYLICVARESASRGGSRYVHETLRPGQTLTISAPRNLFALQEASLVVLLAAGIGITPLYAMALHLERTGVPFTLHYFVRQRARAAFAQELSAPFQHGVFQLHASDNGRRTQTALEEMLPTPSAGSRLYLCGPPEFMTTATEQARARGWEDSRIHREAFAPVVPVQTPTDDETFTITLASTGESWPVPAGKTIARVLQDNGVAVPLSCEMGICGACLTPVLEGEPEHRDTVQSDAEKAAATQHVALCCSRSRTARLVIDL